VGRVGCGVRWVWGGVGGGRGVSWGCGGGGGGGEGVWRGVVGVGRERCVRWGGLGVLLGGGGWCGGLWGGVVRGCFVGGGGGFVWVRSCVWGLVACGVWVGGGGGVVCEGGDCVESEGVACFGGAGWGVLWAGV